MTETKCSLIFEETESGWVDFLKKKTGTTRAFVPFVIGIKSRPLTLQRSLVFLSLPVSKKRKIDNGHVHELQNLRSKAFFFSHAIQESLKVTQLECPSMNLHVQSVFLPVEFFRKLKKSIKV